MPGLADFEVPSFIKPPSQAEAQQLAMERERLAIASQEAANKMFERMQRRVAFTKMMGESKTMQEAGADPMTARSQAFLNNADKLYMGDPDGYARATTAVESAMDQRAAQREFQDYMQQRIKDGVDPGDALFEGWSKFGSRISKSAFSGFTGAYMRSQSSADALEQRQKAEKDRLELERKRLELAKSKADTAAAKRSPALTEATDLADAQAKLKEMPPGPERDRQQVIVDAMLARNSEQEIEVTSTPGGGTTTRIMRVPRGKAAGGDTEKDAKKAFDSALQIMGAADDALRNIDPTSVGPMGKFNEALETVSNIVSPGSMAPTVTGKRQALRLAYQNILGPFRQDAVGGRMTNFEMGMLGNIADATKWEESSDTARRDMEVLKELSSAKLVRKLSLLNKPVPDWALTTLSAPLVNALLKEGQLKLETLTPTQAYSLWKSGKIDKETLRRWDSLTGFSASPIAPTAP